MPTSSAAIWGPRSRQLVARHAAVAACAGAEAHHHRLGYYFRCGITMTLPVLLVTLAALALRLSFNQP